MVIKEKGKYILLEDIGTRNAITTATIPKGTVINITQVDSWSHQVTGSPLLDWTPWDLPVVKIES